MNTTWLTLTKERRIEILNQATESCCPQYLEQARSNYRSQKSSLSPKEKSDYSKCLEALNSIYVNLDRMEESNSVNAELKGL